jgi:hypothetical protein
MMCGRVAVWPVRLAMHLMHGPRFRILHLVGEPRLIHRHFIKRLQ